MEREKQERQQPQQNEHKKSYAHSSHMSSIHSASLDSGGNKAPTPLMGELKEKSRVSSVMGGEVMPKYNEFSDQLVVKNLPNVLAQTNATFRHDGSKNSSFIDDGLNQMGPFYQKYRQKLNQKFVQNRVKKL